jgi:rhamnosyltransferase
MTLPVTVAPSDTSADAIVAIIPVYKPDPDRLSRVLAAAAPQVARIVVVDNGGHLPAEVGPTSGAPEIIRMPHNVGVAAALNAGVQHVGASGVAAFLFLDQDSVPAPDMVRRLVEAWGQLASHGEKVAACGPSHREPGSSVRHGFVQGRGFGFRQMLPPEDEPVVACDFLITSGQLVPRTAIEEVGLMDEPLFIDHVDTEWCFRARSKGYRCFGVRDAVMEHELGTRRKRTWWGRWRQVPVHAPFRYYFIARNSMALRRRDYMPAIWRRHDLVRLAGLFLHNGFSAPEGRAVRAAFQRGLADGLRGRWLEARECAALIDETSRASAAPR